MRPCATSTRKPSTPRSSQKRRIDSNSARTSGCSQLKSGCLRVEDVQVPLAGLAVGLGDARPRGAAEDGLPVVRGQLAVLAAALAEHVALALGRARTGGEGGLEPLVLVGGVVGHHVDDDLEVELVGARDHRVGVGERAEDRVDVAVVGDVVAGVGLRRGVEGREPDGVDAEGAQVGQARGDAGEVTDAVAVAVGPRARVDLVDHRLAPPGGVGPVRGVHGGRVLANPRRVRRRARGGSGSGLLIASRATIVPHRAENSKKILQLLATRRSRSRLSPPLGRNGG